MSYAKAGSVTVSRDSRAWALMPNIANVSCQLSDTDKKFVLEIGALLCEVGQTDRFAVTLLHSHFDVSETEFLGEKLDPVKNEVLTSVYEQATASAHFVHLVPRSWHFKDGHAEALTYIERSDLPQRPVEESDEILLTRVAEIYGRYQVSGRFGFAHPGPMPESGKLWVESEDIVDRQLSLEQVTDEVVKERDSIRTMWIFDQTGKHIIVMGCCARDKNGHQYRHARG